MARMIDGDKLVENLRLIATCWSISPYVSKEKHNGAVDMLREVEREVKKAPNLTPPNEPLTLEQLRQMDGEPVYIVFSPDISGEKPQFWVLVSVDEWNDIYLANKEGWAFNYEEFLEDVEAIYRRPPEGEEDNHGT